MHNPRLVVISRVDTATQKPVRLEDQELHAEVLAAFTADPDIRLAEALEMVEIVQACKAQGEDDLTGPRHDRIDNILRDWSQDPNLPEIVQRVRATAKTYRPIGMVGLTG